MAIITRRWYVYNGAGDQFNHVNYFFITSFPNYCPVMAPDICAVLGIYEIFDPSSTPPITFFGTHPQSFAVDTALFNYILAATGNTTYIPGGTNQKPYLYKRFF